MLFNSYAFIFGFLPVVLAGFWLLALHRRDWALLWLTLASLCFYAWWRPVNVLLIMPSIVVNYGLARALQRHGGTRPGLARAVLLGGIAFNVCFLGYFKYLTFLQSTINDVFGASVILSQVILPLGISFITFQKIAFLIDVHAGRVTSFSFRDYALFVLFFPQLVAGPIVHYREMMPQFRAAPCRFDAENAAVGLSLFFFGLAKKLVLADPLSRMVAPLYAQAAHGTPVALIDAWIAALGFTLQIYFDFSGYSDMALGLGRFCGIRLPANFNSPLKASSIIDFWLRWHISLTRFLTAYIYNPLTLALTRRRQAQGKPVFGGRNTSASAFVTLLAGPTILTMFISGLWHGAGYTYVLWGVLHGMLLSINHAWRLLRQRVWRDARSSTRVMRPVGFVLTFGSVVFGMTLFRAPDIHAAVTMWHGMVGSSGITVPEALFTRLGPLTQWLMMLGVTPTWSSGSFLMEAFLRIGILLLIALCLPNTLEMLSPYEPAIGVRPPRHPPAWMRWFMWAPTRGWAVRLAFVATAGLLSLGQLSEFLYWQF
jgi:D-alanyl-lipoteichoic acid acyltransferase DltB (MBOAT superfamily)